MASLRDTAACIGVTGDFSVVHDFYGYLAKPDDASPNPGFPDLSVLMQVRLLQGRHLHLNLIRVGIESFTPDQEAEIDGAVQLTRDVYEQVESRHRPRAPLLRHDRGRQRPRASRHPWRRQRR